MEKWYLLPSMVWLHVKADRFHDCVFIRMYELSVVHWTISVIKETLWIFS